MQIKTKLLALSVVSALSFSSVTLAANQSFDSRSYGMGGIGVSTADYLTAAFHNPALGARFDESDDVAVLIPAVGAQINDSEDLITQVDDFSDLYDQFQGNPSGDPTQMIDSLEKMKGDQAFVQAGAGFAIAIPSQIVSVNLFAKAYADAFVLTDVSDNDLEQSNWNNPFYQPESNAIVMGVSIMEGGVALSKSFEYETGTLYVGVTPKYQVINTINYSSSVENFDTDGWDSDEYQSDDGAFNMDVGVAYELPQGFVFGLSGRNLISNEYETTNTNGINGTYKVSPMVTGSASFNHDLVTVGVDVDFTENERYTSIDGINNNVDVDGDNTQMAAIGAEFNAWNWAQVRVGYSHDIAGNLDSSVTAGLGLSPFDTVHIDLSASYAGDSQFGAVVQTYLTF